MSEKIEIRIDDSGRLHLEFSGFSGDLCLEEAERLQKVLSGLGVTVSVSDLVMKSAGEIERELGIDRRRKGEIKTGREDG